MAPNLIKSTKKRILKSISSIHDLRGRWQLHKDRKRAARQQQPQESQLVQQFSRAESPTPSDSDGSIPATEMASIGSLPLEQSPTSSDSDDSISAIEMASLGSLPVELVFHIASFLPPAATSCLALTCKWLYDLIHDKWKHGTWFPPGSTMKLQLLHLLEKDLPTMITCDDCSILYRWNSPDYSCPRCTSSFRDYRLMEYCTSHGLFISRSMVNAFLRGAERGTEYGPPLALLNHECQETFTQLPLEKMEPRYISRRVEAKRRSGSLILYRTSECTFLVDKVPEFSRFAALACRHAVDCLPVVIRCMLRHLPETDGSGQSSTGARRHRSLEDSALRLRHEIRGISERQPCFRLLNCA
jgi:hypothetical protein